MNNLKEKINPYAELFANFGNTYCFKKPKNKSSKPLALGYSSVSTQQELSNDYEHDRVWMFKKLCILVLWTRVASALEVLSDDLVLKILLTVRSVMQPVPRLFLFVLLSYRWPAMLGSCPGCLRSNTPIVMNILVCQAEYRWQQPPGAIWW